MKKRIAYAVVALAAAAGIIVALVVLSAPFKETYADCDQINASLTEAAQARTPTPAPTTTFALRGYLS